MITTFGLIFPDVASLKADDVVISSSELPSDQYIQDQGYIFSRGSVSTRESSISLYAETFAAGDDWEDPLNPPGGGGTGGGNVGGPIGDVTPVILILLILMYSIYRSVSVSKRKNL